MLTPHVLERALAEIDFAAEYLGAPPLLYSMNFFATRPGQPVRPDIQAFHRDTDDVKFLPMFFYLSDVGEDARQELRVDDRVVGIEGKRGTVFFSDTMREHRGLKPVTGERIIAWARFGVSNPPEVVQMGPASADRRPAARRPLPGRPAAARGDQAHCEVKQCPSSSCFGGPRHGKIVVIDNPFVIETWMMPKAQGTRIEYDVYTRREHDGIFFYATKEIDDAAATLLLLLGAVNDPAGRTLWRWRRLSRLLVACAFERHHGVKPAWW